MHARPLLAMALVGLALLAPPADAGHHAAHQESDLTFQEPLPVERCHVEVDAREPDAGWTCVARP